MTAKANIAKLPVECGAFLLEDGSPVKIKAGESGYYPQPPTFDPVAFNIAHAITDAQVSAMMAGSAFGWEVPAADAADPSNTGPRNLYTSYLEAHGLGIPNDRLEKRQLLVLSTAHISKATADWLDSRDPKTDWPFCGGHYGEYGWTFYCHESNVGDDDHHIPDDLFALMVFARGRGCDNLLLDRDGEEVEGLPTFDWEAGQ